MGSSCVQGVTAQSHSQGLTGRSMCRRSAQRAALEGSRCREGLGVNGSGALPLCREAGSEPVSGGGHQRPYRSVAAADSVDGRGSLEAEVTGSVGQCVGRRAVGCPPALPEEPRSVLVQPWARLRLRTAAPGSWVLLRWQFSSFTSPVPPRWWLTILPIVCGAELPSLSLRVLGSPWVPV